MSDLDSFFAKKDRKKKKRATPQSKPPAPAPIAASVETSTAAVAAAGPAPPDDVPVAAAPARQDDGWVEFEDPKRQQVNTGGRKVASLKRDSAGVISQPAPTAEENTDASSAAAGEFQGWKASDEVAAAAEKAAAEKAAAEKEAAEKAAKPAIGGVYRPKIWTSRAPAQQGPDVKSASQFPSLADAARANAPEVPASMRAAEKGVKAPVSSGRPRFINSKRT